MTEPIPGELEDTIRRDPDDPRAYLVYADWLAGRGHPRGELIALDHRMSIDPSVEVADARKALVARHPELVGEVDAFGLAEWRWGFVQRLRVARGYYDATPRDAAIERLRAITGHAACRFLRDLHVGNLWIEGDFDYDPVLELELPSLAIFELQADGPRLAATELGEVAPLFEGCPRIESLSLRAGTLRLGPLPSLRRLTLESLGIRRADLLDLLRGGQPRLESLEIWVGGRDRTDVTMDDLAPLLDGGAFPRLERLGLMNCDFADDLCDALARSRIAEQLRELDLSMGTMSDRGVDHLLRGRERLARLAHLDVSKNCLGDHGVDRVAQLARSVVHHSQKEPGDGFVSIGL
jgi:uncharacterized protein (TIGR02996 family)